MHSHIKYKIFLRMLKIELDINGVVYKKNLVRNISKHNAS